MKYIDLFAGCGGLSLGLERAGFDLVLSIEKSEMASETFYHNFIKRLDSKEEWTKYTKLSLDEQFNNKLVSAEVKAVLDRPDLMKRLADDDIDLVVGGPPCQGFSLAGRRNPNDARNLLPWQFLEFVEIVNPKIVIIENVVGISRRFTKHDKDAPFDQLQEALRGIGKGYVVQPVHVNAMHFGVPEHRPRLMILGLRNDVAKKLNIQSTNSLWYSNFIDNLDVNKIPDLAPVPLIRQTDVRTIRDAISDLSDQKNVLSRTGREFLKEMHDSKLWKLKPLVGKTIPNQNGSKHLQKTTDRFRLYQYLKLQKQNSTILNVPFLYSEKEAKETLRKLLKDSDFPAKSPDGTIIAKNLDDLIKVIFELKTKKHSQRALDWDKPSPTVVTLPDDYVHPSKPRIFTVRELARFQSFPDAFEFKSKETTGSERRRFEVPQYSQVGNAVAPLLAYSVGKRFKSILRAYADAKSIRNKSSKISNLK